MILRNNKITIIRDYWQAISMFIILLLAIIISLNLLNISYAEVVNENSLKPNLPKASKGENCVEPVEIMRRNHMQYLEHQRDDTLRNGIRGAKYSLNKCIECHASKDVSANGEMTIKPFCGECHKFAAVAPDCFACHTGKFENSSSNADNKFLKNLDNNNTFFIHLSQSQQLDQEFVDKANGYLNKGGVQ